MEIVVKSLTVSSEVHEVEKLFRLYDNGYKNVLYGNYQNDVCLLSKGVIPKDIIKNINDNILEEIYLELLWLSKSPVFIINKLRYTEVLSYDDDGNLIVKAKNDNLKDIKFYVEKGE
ncbi:hypothetical protein Goe21_01830 [Bacillus phage vB_BsuM-Goe21]|nr:hypothetical protein Goe21_01830 [Bacillus phage vB_BsuM-Goe21]